MMRIHRFIKSILAAGLCLIYLTTNVVLAHAVEASIWAERRKNQNLQLAALQLAPPAPFFNQATTPFEKNIRSGFIPAQEVSSDGILATLPYQYGSVRKAPLPGRGPSEKTIIHIQDVHLNAEAQTNIANAVRDLMLSGRVGLVALEGAFDPIDLSRFRRYPDPHVIRRVADYLLKNNRISGPVFAGLTTAKDIPHILGVDDARHYRANVKAYRDSTAYADGNKKALAARVKSLAEEKKRVFSARLQQFDEKVLAYRADRMGLKEYLSTLVEAAGEEPESLQTYLEAARAEETLDFNRVERERTALLNQLVRKLDQNANEDLVRASVAFRAGQISHADFYRRLDALCRGRGLDVSLYPSMKAYFTYVCLSESIDADRLMQDAAALERVAYGTLARTPEERELVRESRALYLTGKLLDFALTSEEWVEYKGQESLPPIGGRVGGGPEAGTYLSNLFRNQSLAPSPNPSPTGEGNSLRVFEAFYREAEARDAAIAAHLSKAMDKNNASVAVLVTGGFHSKGLRQRLSEKGMTTITFVPTITKIEAANAPLYLSVFAQKKTPLEQLFQGTKLFLAPPPADGLSTAPSLVTAAGVVDAWKTSARAADLLPKARKILAWFTVVIPAKAGIQVTPKASSPNVSIGDPILDSRFRGNDGFVDPGFRRDDGLSSQQIEALNVDVKDIPGENAAEVQLDLGRANTPKTVKLHVLFNADGSIKTVKSTEAQKPVDLLFALLRVIFRPYLWLLRLPLIPERLVPLFGLPLFFFSPWFGSRATAWVVRQHRNMDLADVIERALGIHLMGQAVKQILEDGKLAARGRWAGLKAAIKASFDIHRAANRLFKAKLSLPERVATPQSPSPEGLIRFAFYDNTAHLGPEAASLTIYASESLGLSEETDLVQKSFSKFADSLLSESADTILASIVEVLTNLQSLKEKVQTVKASEQNFPMVKSKAGYLRRGAFANIFEGAGKLEKYFTIWRKFVSEQESTQTIREILELGSPLDFPRSVFTATDRHRGALKHNKPIKTSTAFDEVAANVAVFPRGLILNASLGLVLSQAHVTADGHPVEFKVRLSEEGLIISSHLTKRLSYPRPQPLIDSLRALVAPYNGQVREGELTLEVVLPLPPRSPEGEASVVTRFIGEPRFLEAVDFLQTIGVKEGQTIVDVGPPEFIVGLAASFMGARYIMFDLDGQFVEMANDSFKMMGFARNGGAAVAFLGEFSSSPKSISKDKLQDDCVDFVLIRTGALSDPRPVSDAGETGQEMFRVVKDTGRVFLGSYLLAWGFERDKAVNVAKNILSNSNPRNISLHEISGYHLKELKFSGSLFGVDVKSPAPNLPSPPASQPAALLTEGPAVGPWPRVVDFLRAQADLIKQSNYEHLVTTDIKEALNFLGLNQLDDTDVSKRIKHYFSTHEGPRRLFISKYFKEGTEYIWLGLFDSTYLFAQIIEEFFYVNRHHIAHGYASIEHGGTYIELGNDDESLAHQGHMQNLFAMRLSTLNQVFNSSRFIVPVNAYCGEDILFFYLRRGFLPADDVRRRSAIVEKFLAPWLADRAFRVENFETTFAGPLRDFDGYYALNLEDPADLIRTQTSVRDISRPEAHMSNGSHGAGPRAIFGNDPVLLLMWAIVRVGNLPRLIDALRRLLTTRENLQLSPHFTTAFYQHVRDLPKFTWGNKVLDVLRQLGRPWPKKIGMGELYLMANSVRSLLPFPEIDQIFFFHAGFELLSEKESPKFYEAMRSAFSLLKPVLDLGGNSLSFEIYRGPFKGGEYPSGQWAMETVAQPDGNHLFIRLTEGSFHAYVEEMQKAIKNASKDSLIRVAAMVILLHSIAEVWGGIPHGVLDRELHLGPSFQGKGLSFDMFLRNKMLNRIRFFLWNNKGRYPQAKRIFRVIEEPVPTHEKNFVKVPVARKTPLVLQPLPEETLPFENEDVVIAATKPSPPKKEVAVPMVRSTSHPVKIPGANLILAPCIFMAGSLGRLEMSGGDGVQGELLIHPSLSQRQYPFIYRETTTTPPSYFAGKTEVEITNGQAREHVTLTFLHGGHELWIHESGGDDYHLYHSRIAKQIDTIRQRGALPLLDEGLRQESTHQSILAKFQRRHLNPDTMTGPEIAHTFKKLTSWDPPYLRAVQAAYETLQNGPPKAGKKSSSKTTKSRPGVHLNPAIFLTLGVVLKGASSTSPAVQSVGAFFLITLVLSWFSVGVVVLGMMFWHREAKDPSEKKDSPLAGVHRDEDKGTPELISADSAEESSEQKAAPGVRMSRRQFEFLVAAIASRLLPDSPPLTPELRTDLEDLLSKMEATLGELSNEVLPAVKVFCVETHKFGAELKEVLEEFSHTLNNWEEVYRNFKAVSRNSKESDEFAICFRFA
ncbi:MAG: hypothetical protein LHV69_10240 [Elusimicrobia bacterium]|nr:hypothetical protein [Candidatus Obscuribacterium magneticum]